MSKSLKILLISHAYVAYENRKKVEELAKIKDVELVLLVPKSWKDTLRIVPLENPDVKNYKLISADIIFNGHIAGYLYKNKLWSILKEFKPDIIHLEEEPWSFVALQVLLYKKLLNLKGKLLFFTWENIERNYKFPANITEKFFLKTADFAIAGSSFAKEILIKKGFKKPIKIMVQFGIDLEMFYKQDQTKLRNELGLKDFTIGFLGRFVKEKGIFILLDAFLKLKDKAQLFLMGNGPEKENIENFIKQYELENRVIIHGTVSHHEMPKYINCVNVLVLPSISTKNWREQFGHILIEAFACEVPVIGSNSGAIPEVIENAGLLFKEGSVQELYEQLKFLIEDKNKYNELSLAGRKLCIEKYTNSSIANKTAQIYQQVYAS